jgi:hypothetical protein
MHIAEVAKVLQRLLTTMTLANCCTLSLMYIAEVAKVLQRLLTTMKILLDHLPVGLYQVNYYLNELRWASTILEVLE